MNFIELAEKIIREENRPLTQNEIWEIAKISSIPPPFEHILSYLSVKLNKGNSFLKAYI